MSHFKYRYKHELVQIKYKVPLVPTETGLNKSIMDATQDFREFLCENMHMFDEQKQGTENKKLIETILISKNQVYETQTFFIDHKQKWRSSCMFITWQTGKKW